MGLSYKMAWGRLAVVLLIMICGFMMVSHLKQSVENSHNQIEEAEKTISYLMEM